MNGQLEKAASPETCRQKTDETGRINRRIEFNLINQKNFPDTLNTKPVLSFDNPAHQRRRT